MYWTNLLVSRSPLRQFLVSIVNWFIIMYQINFLGEGVPIIRTLQLLYSILIVCIHKLQLPLARMIRKSIYISCCSLTRHSFIYLCCLTCFRIRNGRWLKNLSCHHLHKSPERMMCHCLQREKPNLSGQVVCHPHQPRKRRVHQPVLMVCTGRYSAVNPI